MLARIWQSRLGGPVKNSDGVEGRLTACCRDHSQSASDRRRWAPPGIPDQLCPFGKTEINQLLVGPLPTYAGPEG
jgi:hypothetical protein